MHNVVEADKLQRSRRVQLHMLETRGAVSQCIQLVDLIQTLNRKLEQKDYYGAQKVTMVATRIMTLLSDSRTY